METIREYVTGPWEERIPTVIDPDTERAVKMARDLIGIRIATSSSCRSKMVGIGGAIHDSFGRADTQPTAFSITLGPRSEQNSYTAELAAIAQALRLIPPSFSRRQIVVFTSNQAALKAISRPYHQSGQGLISQIYDSFRMLRVGDNRVLIVWIPSGQEFHLSKMAKQAAKRATERGQVPEELSPQAKSTLLNRARTKQSKGQTIPQGIGRYSTEMDTALPGRHTRVLYDSLSRREAGILAQLRTGMIHLNGYLHRIGAAESDQCACGQAKETVKHFLFRCTNWDALRTQMIEQTDTRRGSLSYFLGGKAKSDPKEWVPNLKAVHETIKYAICTGRLDPEVERAAT